MKEGLDELYFHHQRLHSTAIKIGARRSDFCVWTSIPPLTGADTLQIDELLEA